eukprot:TRINITY_DN4340_c0_g1_i1.p1 TRINITY_DN4340_c0_g1~~TRINITY_DN4340_c0_g1_i1.p1  ORF type:complete len:233 (+),score=35.62 TRINITY_DN4340_c0_g1_i1:59-757(+)
MSEDKVRYYTPTEVAAHNHLQDCWLTWNGAVYDLTGLVRDQKSEDVEVIVNHAGTDVSHWFDPKTKNLRRHIDPTTGIECYFCPDGHFLDIPPRFPSSEWSTIDEDGSRPWWLSQKYLIGLLTSAARKILIVNTLTQQEHILEVCEEDTIDDIRTKYLAYNSHSNSYVWKRLGKELDLALTLSENGVADEAKDFVALDMSPSTYIPALHIYRSKSTRLNSSHIPLSRMPSSA